MFGETASAFARVAAANALLDRGWGKPVQPLATDQEPLELIHRIERVIVHPEYPPAITNAIDEAATLEAPQAVLPREKVLR